MRATTANIAEWATIMPDDLLPAPKVERVTSAMIVSALVRYYTAPEYAIAFEVAQGTGFSANRHLDAVAMDLWPSRGQALHGIEIKIDLGDWRREKRDPEKAEQIARYLDYFWIAAPKGVVPDAELPHAWGLLEMNDKGVLIISKQAKHTDAQPVTRNFLAAMMRAAGRGINPNSIQHIIAEENRKLEEQFNERVRWRAEEITECANEGAKNWQDLIAALGTEFHDAARFAADRDTIAAIVAVYKSGVTQSYSGLKHLEDALTTATQKIREARKTMNTPEEPAAKNAKRKKRGGL